ncbi:MAG: DUF2723 domain-containing protein [Candidatus Omnitrophica bacterium]|nr:DUF2723 domain-containing protein [Candidatus Omnitrophota bacterium]
MGGEPFRSDHASLAWKTALLTGFCSFISYLLTLAPTVVGGDSGELTTAAVTLGVPHPPGYPLYCLLAHFFSLLPFSEPAYGVNLFSATAASAATGLLSFLIVTSGAAIVPSSKPLFLGTAGWTGGLLWAWSSNFWNQAVIAEVYTLHTFFVIGYLLLLFLWSENPVPKRLYRCSLWLGLSMTNHHLTLLFLPVLLYQGFVTVHRDRTLDLLKTGLKALGFFALPLLLYLYIPIRSWMGAPLDWGRAVTWESFVAHLTRKQYSGLNIQGNLATIFDAKKLFDPDSIKSYINHLGSEYSWLWLAGILGIAVCLKKNIRLLVPLLFIWFFGSFLIWINTQQHHFSHRFSHYLFDVFLLSGEPTLLLWMGWGLLWLFRKIGRTRDGILLMSAGAILLPIGLAGLQWRYNDRNGDYIAYDFNSQILDALPTDAIYFTYGDTNTAVTAYLRLVKNRRPDVLLLDYSCGQVFKETPPYWGPNRNPEKHKRVLESMVDFVHKTPDPVYIAYGHPLIDKLLPHIVPYGPLAHYDPTQDALNPKRSSFRSDFPWHTLKLRGLDKPIAFSDQWNWFTIGDCLLGQVFEKLGAASGFETIDKFSRILLLDSKTWLENGGLSLLYFFQGRLEEALTEQYRVVLQMPNEPTGYFNLGLLCAATGSRENALILWKQALRLKPNWPIAEKALASMEDVSGDPP